jgi:hypothetical protein
MSETCQAHAAALDDVRENSKGYCLTAAGEYGRSALKECFERRALTGASSLILLYRLKNDVRHEEASLCKVLPEDCEHRRPKP